MTSRRRPAHGHAAGEHHRRRRGRGRRRVRAHVPRPRRHGHAARVPAGRSCRSRMREVSKELERSFTQARDHGHDQRPLRRRRRSVVGRRGVQPDRRPRGQGRGRDHGRDAARGDRPRRQHRGHRPRDDEGRDRTGASSRSTATCGRRSRTSTRSATSSAGCGSRIRPRTRGSSRPTRSPASPTSTRWTTSSQPRATYCRPEIASIGLTEAAVRGARPPRQGRQGPVPGGRQGDHRRRVRGLRQDHRRRARRTRRSASTSSGRMPRT